MDLFTGYDRSKTLDNFGVPDIKVIDITKSSTSVSSMKNDDLHTLKIYEDKLGEYGSKITHWSW